MEKTEIGLWMIRKQHTNWWLATSIDSSGMDVFWVDIFHADTMREKEDAEKLATRVRERYPAEKIEVISYDRT